MSSGLRRFLAVFALVALVMSGLYYGTPYVVEQRPDVPEDELRERAIQVCLEAYRRRARDSESNELNSRSEMNLTYERDQFSATVFGEFFATGGGRRGFLFTSCNLDWRADQWVVVSPHLPSDS